MLGTRSAGWVVDATLVNVRVLARLPLCCSVYLHAMRLGAFTRPCPYANSWGFDVQTLVP
jgi:hypothetical protein